MSVDPCTQGQCSEYRDLKRRLERLRVQFVERKKELDQMKESTGFALEVFQRFPLGIMIFQYVAPAELFLAKGNLEAGKLIGFGDRECRGEEFDELWPNARSQGIIQACVNTVQTGEPFVADRVHFQGNGICRAFKIHAFGLDRNRLCLTIEETEGGDIRSENVHPLDKAVYNRR